MRGFVSIQLYVFLLLGFCRTGLLGTDAAAAPSTGKTDSGTSSDSSEEESVQGATGGAPTEAPGPRPTSPFPLEEFERAFHQLAEEISLKDENIIQYKAALKSLFKTTPEAFKEGKPSPRSPHGLLKKMLAARVERGSGGEESSPESFVNDFIKAFDLLKSFKLDKGASPAEALQRLAELTRTSLTPETAETMQQYMAQTAELLRQTFPLHLSDDEEL